MIRRAPGPATLALIALIAPSAPGGAENPGPLPVDIGGAFALTDQYGSTRSQIDADGRARLVFFGYVNCPGICPLVLPAMADVSDRMAARGIALRPVLITVDPARDRVDTMAEPLARLHPDFIGLTGPLPALRAAWRAFSVERKLLFTDPEAGAVFAHGGFVYLLDARGHVLALFPPTLGAERMAAAVATYLAPGD